MRSLAIILLGLFIALSCAASGLDSKPAKYPKYSFGFGLNTGWGRINQSYPHAAALGCKLDYQRNIAPWFSLRLETGYSYNFYMYQEQSFPIENAIVRYYSQPSVYYVSFGPVFYYRFAPFNMFAGISIGGAQTWQKTYTEYFVADANNNVQTNTSATKKTKEFVYSLSPLFGFSYSLGRKRHPFGELEVAFNLQCWLNGSEVAANTNYLPFEYRINTIQLTYRILLEK